MDEALIVAAQQDHQAFRALYDKYADKIFQFIYYRMNHDRSMAYDLTAEVFTRALKTIDQFEWQGFPYSSYLYMVARSVCRDYALKPQLVDSTDIELVADTKFNLTDQTDYKLVWQAIQQLPGATQELFELHILEGLSYEEIGKILHKKPSSLRTTMTRALAKLREQFHTS